MRWFGAPDRPQLSRLSRLSRVERDFDALLRDAHLFDRDKLIFCGVLTSPPADPAPFLMWWTVPAPGSEFP
ncbi:MAG: hypothetical protein WA776_11370 [Xanthobacteraceae bacterium]